MDQSTSTVITASGSSFPTPEGTTSRPAHRRSRNSRNSRPTTDKASSKDGENLDLGGRSQDNSGYRSVAGKTDRTKDGGGVRSSQEKNTRSRADANPVLGGGKAPRSKDGAGSRSGQGKNTRSKDGELSRSGSGKDIKRTNADGRGKGKPQKSSQERFLAGIGAGIQRLKPSPVYKRKQNPDGFTVAVPPRYAPDCDICQKVITDSHSAVSLGNTGLASHFDCVVEFLAKREELKEDEHIVYLGAGDFGVVRRKTEKEPLEVLRRISYEESKHENNAWRRDLALTPAFVVRVLKTTDMMKDEESKAFRHEQNSKKIKGE